MHPLGGMKVDFHVSNKTIEGAGVPALFPGSDLFLLFI